MNISQTPKTVNPDGTAVYGNIVFTQEAITVAPPKKHWLVVRFRGQATEVVGLFDSEDRAFDACKHGAYLTAPIELNKTYTPEDPWRGVKAR